MGTCADLQDLTVSCKAGNNHKVAKQWAERHPFSLKIHRLSCSLGQWLPWDRDCLSSHSLGMILGKKAGGAVNWRKGQPEGSRVPHGGENRRKSALQDR